jgi:hypothetical protein
MLRARFEGDSGVDRILTLEAALKDAEKRN